MTETDLSHNAVVFKGRYYGGYRALHIGLIEPECIRIRPEYGLSVVTPGYTDPWGRDKLFIMIEDIAMYMVCA